MCGDASRVLTCLFLLPVFAALSCPLSQVFATFGASTSGRISFDDVLRYMQRNGEKEDVWDVFGRSMLQDFSARPNR